MTDEELLLAFENCTLTRAEWTHRAHVRVAYQYAVNCPLDEATQRMRTGVKALNAANRVPEAIDQGYHETVTCAFMMLIFASARATGPCATADEYCEAHPEMMDKRLLLQYYSRDLIMSADAKQRFIQPDLRSLEPIPGE